MYNDTENLTELDKKLMAGLKKYRANSKNAPMSQKIVKFDQCLMKMSKIKKAFSLLRDIFSKFDEDKNGTIEYRELKVALQFLGNERCTERDVEAVFHGADIWHTEALNQDAFILCLVMAYVLGDITLAKMDSSPSSNTATGFTDPEAELRDAFNVVIGAYMLFDPELSGSFLKTKMDEIMGADSSRRWNEMDQNKNNEISFTEFVTTFEKWFDDEEE